MNINTNTMISITEANQNFSKVTKLVDEYGSAIILKQNSPKYVLIDFDELNNFDDLNNEISTSELITISKKLINKNIEAYKVLAK